jgi:sialate O-acetylesterase
MDAFTTDLTKIGIPTVASGAKFQQNVKNMTVISNAPGIATGTNLPGGNIEFWPNNYGGQNSANVPGASAAVYDFGDGFTDPADGYGSMQVHNHDAKQTIFAINHWVAGANADLGIGNSAGENPDWTFKANGSSYTSKRLRVYVQTK